jgi:hypothetical protein
VGYVRGLPLLVGLESGMLVLLSSELWFGASDNPLVTFLWSSEKILRGLLEDLVGTICGSSRIYMQCNITFKVCT